MNTFSYSQWLLTNEENVSLVYNAFVEVKKIDFLKFDITPVVNISDTNVMYRELNKI